MVVHSGIEQKTSLKCKQTDATTDYIKFYLFRLPGVFCYQREIEKKTISKDIWNTEKYSNIFY